MRARTAATSVAQPPQRHRREGAQGRYDLQYRCVNPLPGTHACQRACQGGAPPRGCAAGGTPAPTLRPTRHPQNPRACRRTGPGKGGRGSRGKSRARHALVESELAVSGGQSAWASRQWCWWQEGHSAGRSKLKLWAGGTFRQRTSHPAFAQPHLFQRPHCACCCDRVWVHGQGYEGRHGLPGGGQASPLHHIYELQHTPEDAQRRGRREAGQDGQGLQGTGSCFTAFWETLGGQNLLLT